MNLQSKSYLPITREERIQLPLQLLVNLPFGIKTSLKEIAERVRLTRN